MNATNVRGKQSTRPVALIIALLCSLIFISTVSAATYYVSPTGNDTTGDGSESNPWQTISHAIDNASVSDGDTIKLMDDNNDSTVDYEENVDVDKRLTLERYDSDATCPWVKAASTADHVFEITVNAVNISGLKVTGATDNSKAGIYLYDADYCNISGNNATGNWHGIYLNTWCDYNEITNNTANSNTQFGILLNCVVTHNNIADNIANSNAVCGIQLKDRSNHNTLTGNTANSNNENGIRLEQSCDNEVTCNWLAFNGHNGFLLTDVLGDSTGNNITLNNIFANGNYDFRNDQDVDVVATYNYWGTNDDDTINASIYDWQDNHDKGNVTFLPKLTEPDPCAPVPDAAALVLFASGLMLAAVYFVYGRGRKRDRK